MIRQIKNSSNKITGSVEISSNKIVINNIGKPILTITDENIIKEVLNDDIQIRTIEKLYNEYTLSISEIAGMYDRCYSNINKIIKKTESIHVDSRGRRNRAYGHKVSEQQSKRMSASLIGRKNTYYERTPEIRNQISRSLKEYYKEHPEDLTPHIENWKNNKYSKVDFKIGIGGVFKSLKMRKEIRFRSLLELQYLLMIENDEKVKSFEYEPFHIKMENNSSYTPDFLVNNSVVVELKSKKYVENVEGIKEKVEYKKSQAIKYCKEHGYEYKIIYDEDINFDSKRMKYYIRDNKNIVEKYSITFNDPSRMVLK